MAVSKTQQIKNHFDAGADLKAIKIAAKFYTGFTKEEKRSIEIGAALDNVRSRANYEMLGIDVVSEYKKAVITVKAKFYDK